MSRSKVNTWASITIVFLAGSIATAIVPQTIPILGAIAKAFGVNGASLGWIVSFPTMVCAFGALAFGVVVDRVGDVRLLIAGMVLVILGDAGVSLAPGLQWLFAARLFQGVGYVCITVAAPAFIQRVSTGDMRRAAMAFWAAHTPVGFAAAVFFAAQMLAAGYSWRWSFLGHAVAAVVVGIAVLTLRNVHTETTASRSAGTWRVLTSARPYAVAIGALGSAMLQVSVMALLPSLLADRYSFTGPQSALVIVAAMLVNLAGAMVIVTTRVRNIPTIALPLAAALAAFFGYAVVAGASVEISTKLACVMVFSASIGIANSLIWSLLPAAVPSPEAGGATAGLITQGSFLGVLIGPPTLFWIRHEDPMLLAVLALILAALMLVPLYAHARVAHPTGERAVPAVNTH